MNNPATQKQLSLMNKFTLLKFWEPDLPPSPSKDQASFVIEMLLDWTKAERIGKAAGNMSLANDYKARIIQEIHKWFPDWNGDSLKNRSFKKRWNNQTPGNQNEPEESEENEDIQEPEQMPVQEQEEKPEEKEPEQEPQKPVQNHEDPTIDILFKRIVAGLRNFYLVGPAGTGKTTLCKMLGELLDMPVTILSCNSGTSPAEITGFKYPEPRPSAVSQAIGQRGIIVFDEITMLDASVAAAANALLANNEIYTSVGLVKRDPDCIIIATANTIGDGANRVYVGNNQLDAATLDRFVGGFIEVDYSKQYEFNNFDHEVVHYVHGLRKVIETNGFRRIASTRTIIACHKLKKAGLEWKTCATAQWSEEEKKAI